MMPSSMSLRNKVSSNSAEARWYLRPRSKVSLSSETRSGFKIWKPAPSGVGPLNSRSTMLGARKAVPYEPKTRSVSVTW